MKIDYNIKAEHEQNYRAIWESKTTHQIKRRNQKLALLHAKTFRSVWLD